MGFRRRLRRILGRSLAAVGLFGGGCMPFLHPIDLDSAEHVAAYRARSEGVPAACRSRVHVFLVNGLDPFDWSNLTGVRDAIHALGYRKTHFGQLYHGGRFEREIRRLHREEPDARLVLIGFSLGANVVRGLANQAQAEGIPIDLLVYFGGNTLGNEPRDQPENCARVVNVLASGCVWNGAWMDRAENIHERDVYHFGTPSHPVSLEVLTRELAVVASHVSLVEEGPPSSPASSEWDFLMPVARLGGAASRQPEGGR